MANAVAKQRTDPIATFRDLLTRQEKEIAKVLPSFMKPEQMVRVALTCLQKTPGLLKCDAHSVLACVMGAAELGLELVGPLGQAYMVPYAGKATLQIGYRGFMALAFRSDKVVSFPMRVVHQEDEFDVEYGTRHRVYHKPNLKVEDRGAVIAVYSVLNFTRGDSDFEVMSTGEIEAHRKKFCRDTEPWKYHWDAMAMKTTARRLGKRAPVSTDLVKAAVWDEYGEAGVRQDLPAVERTEELTRLRMDHLKDRLGGGEESEPPSEPRDGQPAPADPKSLERMRAAFTELNWGQEQVGAFLEEYPGIEASEAQAQQALAELSKLKETR